MKIAWVIVAAAALSYGQKTYKEATTPSTEKARAPAAKPDNWQRSKECASQAEKVMDERFRRLGRAPEDWTNHYSPKYEKCFVALVDHTGPSEGGGLFFSRWLFDAFERSSNLAYFRDKPICVGACSEQMEILIKSAPCSIGGKTVDCGEAQSFISEHMKN